MSLSTGEEDAAQLYGKAPWSFTATLYCIGFDLVCTA